MASKQECGEKTITEANVRRLGIVGCPNMYYFYFCKTYNIIFECDSYSQNPKGIVKSLGKWNGHTWIFSRCSNYNNCLCEKNLFF